MKKFLITLVAVVMFSTPSIAARNYNELSQMALRTLQCWVGNQMIIGESSQLPDNIKEQIDFDALNDEITLWQGRTIVLMAEIHNVPIIGFGYWLQDQPMYAMLYSYVWGDLIKMKRESRQWQLIIGMMCDKMETEYYQKS